MSRKSKLPIVHEPPPDIGRNNEWADLHLPSVRFAMVIRRVTTDEQLAGMLRDGHFPDLLETWEFTRQALKEFLAELDAATARCEAARAN
jgi:hypothetical protein